MSDFTRAGAQRFAGAIDPTVLSDLLAATERLPADRPGLRLTGIPEIAHHLAADTVIGRIAAGAIGGAARPVRAVLFDKSAATNWSLPWHQDRTIVVRSRIDVPGFEPWSRKQGLQHVEPPFPILAGMVTLRVHLDPVDTENAPLLIAPGSHRLGRVPEPEIAAAVARCGTATCLAAAGDVWAYATPIIHASHGAQQSRRRRVLQVDYAMADLPGGLEWLGV